jgi:hypothetical protein
MTNLSNVLISVFEQDKEAEVSSISFSAIAIGPELITSSANIPDQETFDGFKSIIDENMANTFEDLFKKAKQIDGVTIDFAFSYNGSTAVLKLAGRKTKLKRTSGDEWFGLNMAELLINSKDTALGDKTTLLERAISHLKSKKVKSYSREYIGTLLDFIKQEIDKLRERTRIT